MVDTDILVVLLRILLGVNAALLAWVGFSITAVLRGVTIPKATHEREIKILTDQVASKTLEASEWRGAYLEEAGVSQEERNQKQALLDQFKTMNYASDEIRKSLAELAFRKGETHD